MNNIQKGYPEHNSNNMGSIELLQMDLMQEIKLMLMQQANKLDEQNTLLEMAIPAKVSLSYLVECTGKTRQAMREYVMNNYIPKSDFWKEGGKIFVSRNVATAVLKRGA
jgi:hypothetical protein